MVKAIVIVAVALVALLVVDYTTTHVFFGDDKPEKKEKVEKMKASPKMPAQAPAPAPSPFNRQRHLMLLDSVMKTVEPVKKETGELASFIDRAEKKLATYPEKIEKARAARDKKAIKKLEKDELKVFGDHAKIARPYVAQINNLLKNGEYYLNELEKMGDWKELGINMDNFSDSALTVAQKTKDSVAQMISILKENLPEARRLAKTALEQNAVAQKEISEILKSKTDANKDSVDLLTQDREYQADAFVNNRGKQYWEILDKIKNIPQMIVNAERKLLTLADKEKAKQMIREAEEAKKAKEQELFDNLLNAQKAYEDATGKKLMDGSNESKECYKNIISKDLAEAEKLLSKIELINDLASDEYSQGVRALRDSSKEVKRFTEISQKFSSLVNSRDRFVEYLDPLQDKFYVQDSTFIPSLRKASEKTSEVLANLSKEISKWQKNNKIIGRSEELVSRIEEVEYAKKKLKLQELNIEAGLQDLNRRAKARGY